MALEEATRPITVRQGERVTRIPAMQAVIRSMFRLAAEGDPIAQRQLTGRPRGKRSRRIGEKLSRRGNNVQREG
jgi:hypothetical protein